MTQPGTHDRAHRPGPRADPALGGCASRDHRVRRHPHWLRTGGRRRRRGCPTARAGGHRPAQLAAISSARASDNWERVDPRFPHFLASRPNAVAPWMPKAGNAGHAPGETDGSAADPRGDSPRAHRTPSASGRPGDGCRSTRGACTHLDGRGVTIAFVESTRHGDACLASAPAKGRRSTDARSVKSPRYHAGHDAGSEANSRAAVAPPSPSCCAVPPSA